MLPPRRLALYMALLLAIIACCGCGPDDSLGRQAISGNVTFQGQPLDQGTIRFVPQGPAGQGGGARVTNGHYRIAQAQGLPPGKYLVRLHSSTAASVPAGSKGPLDPRGGRGDRPGIERIPRRYNVRSDIVVEVVAGGGNRFDFNVTLE